MGVFIISESRLPYYAAAWIRWWNTLLPYNRIDSLPVDLDWSGLRIPGINGIFNIIASLAWWGVAVHSQGKEEHIVAWKSQVNAVCLAIEIMAGLPNGISYTTLLLPKSTD